MQTVLQREVWLIYLCVWSDHLGFFVLLLLGVKYSSDGIAETTDQINQRSRWSFLYTCSDGTISLTFKLRIKRRNTDRSL